MSVDSGEARPARAECFAEPFYSNTARWMVASGSRERELEVLVILS